MHQSRLRIVEYEDSERYQLVRGDVLDQLATFPDEYFHCIVTSPPYNLGINYGEKVNDKRSDYLEWMKEVFAECKRVLKEDGSLFLNVGYSNKNPWIAMDLGNALRDLFQLQNLITWVKNISVDDKSYGHFKPINSERFITPTNETIYHFTKNGKVKIHRLDIGVPYMHKSNLKERSKKKNKTGKTKEDLRCRGNTWFIKYETIQNKGEKGSHPATFPLELAKMCIKLALGKEKDKRVLDPFVGSGTTVIAALKQGHYSVGIDISSDYLHFANRRISEFV